LTIPSTETPGGFSGTKQLFWWDLGATELELSDDRGKLVVQRHAVDDWELV